jgi:hypothetical protein
MGMIERLKAQDVRHAALDKRVAALEAALNELLASLTHEEETDEGGAAELTTLDGVVFQSAERDQSEPL